LANWPKLSSLDLCTPARDQEKNEIGKTGYRILKAHCGTVSCDEEYSFQEE